MEHRLIEAIEARNQGESHGDQLHMTSPEVEHFKKYYYDIMSHAPMWIQHGVKIADIKRLKTQTKYSSADTAIIRKILWCWREQLAGRI